MRILRRLGYSLPLLAVVSLPGYAQEGRRGRGPGSAQGGADAQRNWVSFGIGFMQLAPVVDGGSDALWDFGQGFPVTFTLEREVGSGVTAGLAGSYTRMPLVYTGSASACTQCDAHATVATYGFNLHGGAPRGGDTGLYQTFHVFLGAIQFGSFERDAPKTDLPPERANKDFLFTLGYGFGYGLARDWRLELIGDYMNSVHERDKLAGNAQTLARHFMATFGLRVGF